MNNDITVDVDELLKLEDGSVIDYHICRQIGLITCDFSGKYSPEVKRKLSRKIPEMYQIQALYPHVVELLY